LNIKTNNRGTKFGAPVINKLVVFIYSYFLTTSPLLDDFASTFSGLP